MARDPYLESLSFNALIAEGNRQAPILMECEPASSARLEVGKFWQLRSPLGPSSGRVALVRVSFDAGNEALFEEYHRMTQARIAFMRNQEKGDGFDAF